MSQEQNQYREQMEVRLVALIMGEASAFETAELHSAMEKDAGLAAFYAEMKGTVELVQEASKKFIVEAPVADALPKLSTERREALLQTFKVVKPQELKVRSRRPWLVRLGWAAGLVLVGSIAALNIPNFSRSRVATTTLVSGRTAQFLAPAPTEHPGGSGDLPNSLPEVLSDSEAADSGSKRETHGATVFLPPKSGKNFDNIDSTLGEPSLAHGGIGGRGGAERGRNGGVGGAKTYYASGYYGIAASLGSGMSSAPEGKVVDEKRLSGNTENVSQQMGFLAQPFAKGGSTLDQRSDHTGRSANTGGRTSLGDTLALGQLFAKSPPSASAPEARGDGSQSTAAPEVAPPSPPNASVEAMFAEISPDSAQLGFDWKSNVMGGAVLAGTGNPVLVTSRRLNKGVSAEYSGKAEEPANRQETQLGISKSDLAARTPSPMQLHSLVIGAKDLLGRVNESERIHKEMDKIDTDRGTLNIGALAGGGRDKTSEKLTESTVTLQTGDAPKRAGVAKNSLLAQSSEPIALKRFPIALPPLESEAKKPAASKPVALADAFEEKAEEPQILAKELKSVSEAAQVQKPNKDADVPVTRTAVPLATPQPEIDTRENAFSTFSLNISDVSFKLAAASLEKGSMPAPGSIRVEEFINAFNYHDPAPLPGSRLAFAWESARYPFAHNRDVLRLAVQTAARGRELNKPLNLVVLLDNSGSMERPDRVAIVREALKTLAKQLGPQDRISIIAFARTARLWVDGMAGGKPEEFLKKVLDLNPEGGTNLEDAMNLGYATAEKYFMANGVNRVIMLTDGAANLGNAEPEELKKKVVANRQRGIALDCFGIGWEGYNDDLLEVLSRNGDGRYGFLNQPEQAGPEFADQLAGALNVAASDVKTQVEFNPARVVSWRQIGYARHQLTKEQFRDNSVDAAEIAAAEQGNALYVLEVNPQGSGPLGVVRVRYKVLESGEYVEQEWPLAYQPKVPTLDQAGPAMRLAVTASAFGEWLSQSPYAAEMTPGKLNGILGDAPQFFAPDPRPQILRKMILKARSITGE